MIFNLRLWRFENKTKSHARKFQKVSQRNLRCKKIKFVKSQKLANKIFSCLLLIQSEWMISINEKIREINSVVYHLLRCGNLGILPHLIFF